jgi:malate dehydrogenase
VGTLGVPIVVGPEGWSRVLVDELAPDEERRLAAVHRQVQASLASWREDGEGSA